jgi:acetyl/propionyl-CoA carboxylase alpha subunit/acetyl-CoA carboxylase carboxyltransferase component
MIFNRVDSMRNVAVDGGRQTVLIANRGEIAIRVCRAVAELGWRSVVVYSEDDASSLHTKKGDVAVALGAAGAHAYLDIDRMIAVAREHGCTMVHPGYGFLSEREDFAQRCRDAGLIFVGPSPDTLRVFGNKASARKLAEECDVPRPRGTGLLDAADEARALLAELGGSSAIMLKAVAGGGGRGIRIVRHADEVASAVARCRSEAKASFGDDRVYAEELIENARHIEVQLVGDGAGGLAVIGERECTLQRRQQKLLELAPSPSLSDEIRRRLFDATLRIANRVNFASLGTFEFLVCKDPGSGSDRIMFMEVNPRLQVEHTVTEQVAGVDLVQLQLRIAAGARLDTKALPDPMRPRGMAMQLRINMETMRSDGSVSPSIGTISDLDLPSGPGVRVDTAAYAGFRSGVSFDSLLAKLIVHTPSADYQALLRKGYRALCETRIDGIATNLRFLQSLLLNADVVHNRIHTRFIDERVAELLDPEGAPHPALHFTQTASETSMQTDRRVEGPAGSQPVATSTACRVVEVSVREGDRIVLGQPLAITESMKMEFVVQAPFGGVVAMVAASKGDALPEGAPLLYVVPDGASAGEGELKADEVDLDVIRGDLAEVFAAHHKLSDAARPDAVARRCKTNQRTARENVADLCDEGSFHEYGGLVVAARRNKNSFEELQTLSPADGLITGVGTVNAEHFGPDRTRCAVLAYDYTVFAGTQGFNAHAKKRRIIRFATKWRLPIVLFAEGGGGRPGDSDDNSGLKLYNATFWGLARLSGEVPIVAIVSGRCFAGNAALVSCADIVIAAEDATIGMGGPAMIEGGGLGIVPAEEVGPVSVQSRNGVVDVVVRDEEAAVAVAKQFMSYFQGALPTWECADQRRLRHIVPEAPRRAYNMREVINTLADTGSVLEMRPDFGVGMITAFIRIEGQPIAVLANNPAHLAGAIDAEGADKAAQFAALAESLRLPFLTLCDTPGFMVGPEAEKVGLVRRSGKMFVNGSRLTVPLFTIVVRKAYGLGALAMVGGNSFEQMFCVAWPTGHFGKMGLEGHVKLAYRKELASLPDEAAREARIREMVSELHDRGSALNTAPFLSIDDVIDPMESRKWLLAGLQIVRQRERRQLRREASSDGEPFGSAWCD